MISKTRFRIVDCFLLTIITLSGISAFANSCSQLYSLKINTFKDFSKVTSAPLPQKIIYLIEKLKPMAANVSYMETEFYGSPWDRETRLKKVTLGDGEGFVIGIEHLEGDSIHVGEHIAAAYISKIVQKLYPKAQVVDGIYPDINLPNVHFRYQSYLGWRHAYPKKRIIFLGIRDFQEKMMHFDQVAIEMNDVKLANPGMAGIPHHFFRRSLGIPKNKFALSLYFKQPEGNGINSAPSMGDIIGRMKQADKIPDIIFASGGGGNHVSAERAFGTFVHEYEVMNLSDWFEKYDANKKWIVLNDLRGYMPHILNVSDLAVISGPINIMEPMTEGVPLLFFNNPDVITDYNVEAFNKMAELAVATNGAWEIKNMESFEANLKIALENRNPVTPPFLLNLFNENGKTFLSPVDRLIQIILDKVGKAAALVETIKSNPPVKRSSNSQALPYLNSLNGF